MSEAANMTPQEHIERIQQHLSEAGIHLQELGKLRPKRILDSGDPRDKFDVFILYADDRLRQVGDYIATAKEYLGLRASDE